MAGLRAGPTPAHTASRPFLFPAYTSQESAIPYMHIQFFLFLHHCLVLTGSDLALHPADTLLWLLPDHHPHGAQTTQKHSSFLASDLASFRALQYPGGPTSSSEMNVFPLLWVLRAVCGLYLQLAAGPRDREYRI